MERSAIGFQLWGIKGYRSVYDHAGLERLLRYCARRSPPNGSSRSMRNNVVYRLPKPQRDGGVSGGWPPETASRPAADAPGFHSPAHHLWAILLERLFETFPLVCPDRGAGPSIVAFITDAAPVERIVAHIGESAQPPPIAPARGPPALDDGREPLPDLPNWDAMAQMEPGYAFDQQVQWWLCPPPSACLPLTTSDRRSAKRATIRRTVVVSPSGRLAPSPSGYRSSQSSPYAVGFPIVLCWSGRRIVRGDGSAQELLKRGASGSSPAFTAP